MPGAEDMDDPDGIEQSGGPAPKLTPLILAS